MSNLSRRELVDERQLDQFKNSKRLNELIDVLLSYVVETDDLIADVALRRFKDTAEGVWLDWVAEIVGIFNRPLGEYPPEEMFAFTDIASRGTTSPSLTQGFGTKSENTTGGRYRSLRGNPGESLINDANFKSIINAKIAANFSGPAIPDIWDYIYRGFGIETDLEEIDNGISNTGLVLVYIRSGERALSDYERRILIEYAPVQPGTRIQIANWVNP